jgi:tRNA threonylcarbamoyladenosine biosynthesis protein TsaB
VLVLAIESAADAAGVALADDLGTLVQATLGRGRRHAETIAPSIKSCCAAAGVKLAQVEAVVVDIGPGLFTGLRVGVGTAKALAYALGAPLVAVSSLEVLATAASASTPTEKSQIFKTGQTSQIVHIGQTVIAVLDARRGEVVSAEFGVAATADASWSLARIGDDRLETPAELASRLGARHQSAGTRPGAGPGAGTDPGTGAGFPSGSTLVGDGALRYAGILENIAGVRIGGSWLASPPVAVVAGMGVELARRGEFQDPLTLAPRYVRHADARINWESRPPRSGTI